LPDDRAMNRLAGGALPDNGGFALIGDADRRDLRGLDLNAGAVAVQRLAERAQHRLPDLLGLVLDPARLGEVLRELSVATTPELQLLVEHQHRGPGGPLIDRDDEFGHAP